MRSTAVSTILSDVNGITVRAGVIDSADGSAKTNLSATIPFNLQPSGRYVLQANVDVAVTPSPLVTTPTDIATVSADPAKDLVIPAGQPCSLSLRQGQNVLSVAAADGTSPFSCKVLLLS